MKKALLALAIIALATALSGCGGKFLDAATYTASKVVDRVSCQASPAQRAAERLLIYSATNGAVIKVWCAGEDGHADAVAKYIGGAIDGAIKLPGGTELECSQDEKGEEVCRVVGPEFTLPTSRAPPKPTPAITVPQPEKNEEE